MTVAERVKSVRLAQSPKMSMEAFGARLGVTKSAISLIESGKNTLTDQMARLICREFGVSEVWLRTGVGEMRPGDNRAEEIARSVRDLFSDRPETIRTAVLTTLLRFDPEGPEWAVLEKILSEVMALMNKKSPEP